MPANDLTDFQFLAENSVDIICRARLDYSLAYVSPSCLRILGWSQREMMQAPPLTLMVLEDALAIDDTVARINALGLSTVTLRYRMRKKDGSTLWMEANVRHVRDVLTGEVTEYVMILRDIGERKQLEELLATQALTDSLTGLANRRSFDEALIREWKRTVRERSQLSLLLIDIDRFKSVNDHFGHQVGDQYLRAVSAALSRTARAPDTVARYGGEEIAIILPATDAFGLLGAAERLRVCVQELQLTNVGNPEHEGTVTVSIGGATAHAAQYETSDMPESLLRAADNALYQAKRAGRNRIAIAEIAVSNEIAGSR